MWEVEFPGSRYLFKQIPVIIKGGLAFFNETQASSSHHVYS